MPIVHSVARTILGLLVLVAIGQQFLLHIRASHDALNFISYFTNLANLSAAAVLLWSAATGAPRGSMVNDVARYISAVNMAIVGIVFSLLLRNVDLGDLLPWVNFLLHYVMPVAVVLDWLSWPPGSRLKARHMAMAMLFPALYLAYSLLRGAGTGWYPYPFLDPAYAGGYGGVAMYALGILAAFVFVCGALLLMGNRRKCRRTAPPAATP
jgi:hypothetical protein